MHQKSLICFGYLVVMMSGVAPALKGAVQDRIVGGSASKMAALPHSISPKLGAAVDLGDADGNVTLNNMTLRFRMSGAQTAALSQLLVEQQNPASAKYRQWLTPEQFASEFGLSSADLAEVSRWLTSQGFKITATARSRTFIQFSGTVAQAQNSFHTSIHKVSVQGEEHLANLTAASLPSGIAGVVGALSGLDDFKLKPRTRLRQVQADADAKFTSSVSRNTYIAPADFYTIYDEKPLLASSINGTGITIAIAGQTDISLSDVAAFRAAAGLTANVPRVMLATGSADPGTVSADLGEAQLDVEWSGAVAPSATIVYANSTNVLDSLIYIIDNKLGSIASISYGDCESGYKASDIDTLNQAFMQANAEGMTVVGPAGDAGATDCDFGTTTSATHGLAVDFPASSPYVTGLGGTMFDEAGGSYFAATNDASGGSAISYIPEAVWNETAEDILGKPPQFGAGGGGVSSLFTKPVWQSGTGVPNDSSRDVPDVSLNAAANHDGYLICVEGSCANGFRSGATPTSTCKTGNCLKVVGGTSVSAPAFAGILALVQQKTGAATANANPTIYALADGANYSVIFHDTTAGNNVSPCTAGTPNCPSGGNIGYKAGVGYDLASGWGSVDAYNLANNWIPSTAGGGATTIADFILTPATATVTTKSGTDAAGIVLTVTPINGFIGSVVFRAGTTSSALSATPNFSVTPVVITSTASGTTTLTLSAYVVNGRAVGASGRARFRSATLASAKPSMGGEPSWYAGSGAALAGVLLLMLPRRQKLGTLLTVTLAALSIAGTTGCGGGSAPLAGNTNTAPGTYTIDVIATATDATGTPLSHSTTVTFIVQ